LTQINKASDLGYQPYQRAVDPIFDTSAHGVVAKQMVVIAGGPDSANYYAKETLVRVERTLRITPAMHLNVTDHVWTVSELVTAALGGEVQRRVEGAKRQFRVIERGRQ
jgi:hypothetical protein